MSALKMIVSREAIDRFAERYPDGSDRASIVPRLQLALKLARAGKGNELRSASTARKIFDVELPADAWNPEPYTIRILADLAVTAVITVLPPEFRTVMHAQVRKRELRAIVDEDTIEPEPEPAEPVVLTPPVKVGLSLGDKLRAALATNAA